MPEKGNISINAKNIMPVIKKWLYSDKDIFVRELVSNGCDAISKLKRLCSMGAAEADGDYRVDVVIDKAEGTLTFTDNGLGMTAEEVKKYIAQVAFSGAEDFLSKYKADENGDNGIIGHFGLGFYSAFMVAKKVVIDTLSYLPGAEAARWISEDGMEYEMETSERTQRGTSIKLYLNDDESEFLEIWKLRQVLEKHCGFMSVPVYVSEIKPEEPEKEGEEKAEPAQPQQINDVSPLWLKKPSDVTDEEYREFYHKVFHDYDEPLFWIHLNAEYPFNLKGILYFPRIKNNIEIHRNKIQLYCNQVFVTDQVENIVPDFLTLLHGVIDSPDIPLNVSRSYLQSDANVKKISSYITKKVSDRLQSIFKNDRKDFEEKWDDLKLFIHYGMLSEQDFYDKAKGYALFKDIDGKCFTYEEYRDLIKDAQTDKDGNLIYLYATDKDEQYTYIQAARDKGYSVLLFDGQLDTPLVGLLEQKFEKSRFSRVDGDVVDRLIRKEEEKSTELSEADSRSLSGVFTARMPKMDKTEFHVETAAMGENAAPVVITQSEYMRRMKDMSRYQQGMSFYGEMPDMYNLVLNADHRLVKEVLADMQTALGEKLQPIENELKGLQARKAAVEESQKDKKYDELTDDDKAQLRQVEDDIEAQEKARRDVWAGYGEQNPVVPQLIDLALLHNGLLRGEALSRFIARSVDLIK